MKKLQFLALLWLVLCIASPQDLSAQKLEKKATLLFIILDDNNVEHKYFVTGNSFVTQSGNLLRSYKIKVPQDVLENISFGAYANKIIGVSVTNIEGTGETAEGFGYLNKSGNLTINLHINGSGNLAPKGWF